MVLTSSRFRSLIGFVMLLALAGCDIYIPIFHEDPTALREDRSEAAKELDDRIRGDILAALVDQEVGTLKNVTIDVYEQNVLLVGTVTSPEVKSKMGMVAQSAKDAKEIINDIQVVADSSIRDKAEDLSIENQLKSKLRESSSINSFNLRWHSVNGVVYMFGRVMNNGERDRALEIARSVAGVKEVVDHMSVRPPEGGQSWLDNLL